MMSRTLEIIRPIDVVINSGDPLSHWWCDQPWRSLAPWCCNQLCWSLAPLMTWPTLEILSRRSLVTLMTWPTLQILIRWWSEQPYRSLAMLTWPTLQMFGPVCPANYFFVSGGGDFYRYLPTLPDIKISARKNLRPHCFFFVSWNFIYLGR